MTNISLCEITFFRNKCFIFWYFWYFAGHTYIHTHTYNKWNINIHLYEKRKLRFWYLILFIYLYYYYFICLKEYMYPFQRSFLIIKNKKILKYFSNMHISNISYGKHSILFDSCITMLFKLDDSHSHGLACIPVLESLMLNFTFDDPIPFPSALHQLNIILDIVCISWFPSWNYWIYFINLLLCHQLCLYKSSICFFKYFNFYMLLRYLYRGHF